MVERGEQGRAAGGRLGKDGIHVHYLDHGEAFLGALCQNTPSGSLKYVQFTVCQFYLNKAVEETKSNRF